MGVEPTITTLAKSCLYRWASLAIDLRRTRKVEKLSVHQVTDLPGRIEILRYRVALAAANITARTL